MKKVALVLLASMLLVSVLGVSAAGHMKHGLGMVTSIGTVADATAEKAGTAQVNTTVCSVVLDAEGKILSVVWDVQQSRVSFDAAGKVTVPAAETLLTKVEKGENYGMRKASAIGKEWFEQIAAFEAWVVGQTLEEVLAIETFQRDASHPNVPTSADLTGSVTITVGDYLASLQKAVAAATAL
ncbi:MAG TPA: hypothetical protein VLA21_08260 [Candidatus Limnocylindria bacterium]|nr:hypothetical protein [Candidatus Limnocylindria bacterium]